MEWNKGVELLKQIKLDFIYYFQADNNDIYYYPKEQYSSVINYWVSKLNDKIDNQVYKKFNDSINTLQYHNMVLLRYNFETAFQRQLYESYDDYWNFNGGIWRCFRSLVVDITTMDIVLCGFDKFFNLNEIEETQFDNIKEKIIKARHYEVSNKLDGSMQLASYYNNNLVVAGSSSLDIKKSWRLQYAYDVLGSDQYHVFNTYMKNHPELTFIFESISKDDVHVVQYSPYDYGLHLIGIREKDTGLHWQYKYVVQIANLTNIPTTELFYKSLDDIMEDVPKYKSNEKEGYVIKIDNYFVKIKMDDYIFMHKNIMGQINKTGIIHSIADGYFDDFLSKIPHAYQPEVIKTANIVFKYITLMQSKTATYYNNIIDKTNNKKDFMITVDNTIDKKYSGYVKNWYNQRTNNYLKSQSGKYKKFQEIEDELNEVVN